MGITCRQGSWDPAAGLWEAACTALPPVVFILAMQSEGRRKSPKEWLVAGSKLLPWTALRGDQGTGSWGGRGKSLLGGIRGQLAGREVQRVRTKCSVCRRLCRVTCQLPAEVMSHGSPPKLQRDLLAVDVTCCQSPAAHRPCQTGRSWVRGSLALWQH